MHEASRGHRLTCYSATDAPFLRYEILAQAEGLWREAEQAAAHDPELLARVKLAHLPVRYVWLSRWVPLRKECQEAGAKWPLPESRKEVADEWTAVAKGMPGKPWSKVTRLNEGGLTPDEFMGRFCPGPTIEPQNLKLDADMKHGHCL